jgi:hypothetical protein
MAWSWSHAAEAYDDAHANLREETLHFLQVAYAEILSHHPEHPLAESEGFVEAYYKTNLEAAKRLTREELIDAIWSFAEEDQTCDNGGWNAWVCPYGCHTVPFSRSTSITLREGDGETSVQ